MYLTALATGLMWAWFLIVPPGSGGYADQLGEDIAQLRQPRSVRYRLEGSLQAGGQQLPVRGQGAFVQPDRFQLSLEAAGQRFEQVVIGQTTYLRSPNSPSWQVVSLPTAAGGRAPRSGVPLPPGSEQTVLDALRSFQLVGTETLDGASTRHYHGDVDLLSLVRAVAPEQPTQETFESFKLTLDYWIGVEDHYLHQIALLFDVRLRSTRAGVPNALTANLRATFFDFDQPITIAAPIGPAAPVQAPAQVPTRLPRTGESAEALLPLALGWGLVAVGLRVRRKQASRSSASSSARRPPAW